MSERYSPGPEEMGFAEKNESEFDREKEKEHRKEIRKALSKKISESLKNSGFKKSGNSIWVTEVSNNKLNMLYLQRGQFDHSYYIEAGVCENPSKEKNFAITDCRQRQRIEYIVKESDFTKEQRQSGDPDMRKQMYERVREVDSFLNFEEPGVRDKYSGEYFVPSVYMDVAEEKIEAIGDIVKQYVPEWLENG
ncbi:hypothetical protein COX25_00405 [bacterium (Candidatus Howlettbacteria) CG23_combo_of_CG06-09_8_20_14_all_37_9]|nr:MAG: hypothetical protein COX25_00405 [bacterium (Candidatus Howlettbacteria) CG23_combo_of_CG06-09_8_20_14_all_37_9]